MGKKAEILERFGKSLVFLAQKQYHESGDNVGMALRRIIEGSSAVQFAPELVKMSNLNCYSGHGAVDLETIPGESCGVMSLDQCHNKCVSLGAACQGITVSPRSDNQVDCYRRGSIEVDKCDVGVSGYDTFVSTSVKVGVDSETHNIASFALYALAQWGLVSSQQTGLGSTLETATFGDFLEGLLEGLISDTDDFSKCVAEAPKVGSALKQAKATVTTAARKAMTAAVEAKRSCVVVFHEGEKLAGATFADIKNPSQVMTNIQATQVAFLTDLGKSLEALAANDFVTAGTLSGMALRRAVEGAQSSMSTVIV